MKLLACICVVIISFTSHSQHSEFKIITDLPFLLKEISGIENSSHKDSFWAINDSGNTKEIFLLNLKGDIIKSINIENSKNKDWEDICTDRNGNLYIGDFGNNKNHRENLIIYKINKIDNIKGSIVKAQKIHFSLEDQKNFPPSKYNLNYDIEAMIHYNKNIYLFTKSRAKPYNGLCKLYRLSDQKGRYIAELISEIYTCYDYKKCSITGASISPDNKTIALLMHNKVMLLSDFSGDDFFEGYRETIYLNHNSQKEAIYFKNNKTLIIADERNKSRGGNLYVLTF